MKQELTSGLSFAAPNHRPYEGPFIAYALGRDIFGDMQEWKLFVDLGNLYLSNEVGAKYELGELDSSVVHLSMAFLQFDKLYIILDFNDGSSRFYRYDLETKTLTTVMDLQGLTTVCIAYCRQYDADNLIVVGVKAGEGICTGMFNGQTSELGYTVTTKQSTENLKVHKIGLSTTKQFLIESVVVKE